MSGADGSVALSVHTSGVHPSRYYVLGIQPEALDSLLLVGGGFPVPRDSVPGPHAHSCNEAKVLPSQSCVPVRDR